MRAAWIAGSLFLVLANGAWAFDNEAEIGPYRVLHGHGELVRLAARGTPFEAVAPALDHAQFELDFPGFRGPDVASGSHALGPGDLWTGLMDGMQPGEQRKHFLRWWSGLPRFRTVTHPLSEDWQDAVGYFRSELVAARAAEGFEALRHLGHALHTLQDSYAPAHVRRSPEGRILAMSYYPSDQHAYVGAAGDRVVDDHGQLTPAASAAVEASHALLVGYAQARTASAREFERFLDDFEARYLALQK